MCGGAGIPRVEGVKHVEGFGLYLTFLSAFNALNLKSNGAVWRRPCDFFLLLSC